VPGAKSVVKLVLPAIALSYLAPCSARGQHYPPAGAKSGFVTTSEGVRIHYLEAGPGSSAAQTPAILFVPGWTMPAEIWAPQIAHFSRTRRVVAMDPRSQGQSTKTSQGNASEQRAGDIRAVAQQLKLPPVILVGWSLGVMDLAAYVDQFGCEGVSGLVLVDGTAGYDPDPSELKQFKERVQNLVKDRPKATAEFVRSMYNKPQSEAYLQRITRAALETPANTTLALLLALFAADYRPALSKIQRPTLIVGVRRRNTNAFEDMQKRIPHARLAFMDGVGHALFVDDAPRFNSLLENFLKSLETAK
jgi:non-heme chloroperoxidase